MRESAGLRFWSMKSLPIARRCSRKASSIFELIVVELGTAIDSGAGDRATLVVDGEFACVSATASSLALDWKSFAFKIGVMSAIEFWAQLLTSWVEVMTSLF